MYFSVLNMKVERCSVKGLISNFKTQPRIYHNFSNADIHLSWTDIIKYCISIPNLYQFLSSMSLLILSLFFIFYFSPDDMFLSSIGHFPLVYWMTGKISWYYIITLSFHHHFDLLTIILARL